MRSHIPAGSPPTPRDIDTDCPCLGGGRLRSALGLALGAALLGGCGGGSGSEGTVPFVKVTATGRVVFAGLGEQTLDVYRASQGGPPLATTTTSGRDNSEPVARSRSRSMSSLIEASFSM